MCCEPAAWGQEVSMIANLHPADELHELRAQKGEIDRRIREVRALILELPSAERFGSNYAAEVVGHQRAVLDKTAIAEEMGHEWLMAHSTQSTTFVVRLAPLTQRSGTGSNNAKLMQEAAEQKGG